MSYDTYQRVKWIDENLNNRGKYLQIILAEAFRLADVDITDIQLVEGFDLEFEFEGVDYGLEVKTTGSDTVSLAEKDLEDMDDIRNRGMVPGFAVLQLGEEPRWWISRAEPAEVEKLRSGAKTISLPFTAFRAAPHQKLQETARANFDEALRRAVEIMETQGYDEGVENGLDSLKKELGLSG
jgi:hypothetical protein